MRKVLISAAVAASALAVASPAAAQYAPPPAYGYNPGYGYNQGYGANWLYDFRNQRYARMMQDRVQRIRADIRNMGAQRILSYRETRNLDSQARNLQDRIFRYSRYGVTRNEARNIDRSVRRLEERVVREANDWNGRRGVRRYNPFNYNQYWTQYGNYAYGDRDHDGRNDRYEDDRGYRHDFAALRPKVKGKALGGNSGRLSLFDRAGYSAWAAGAALQNSPKDLAYHGHYAADARLSAFSSPAVRGEGVYLYGENGEKYLDFAAGIAVNLLGHGHPHLTEAIQEQAATLIHVSNLYGSPQGEAFAQRLCDLTFADTVFFTNSGAEAVECAIKTARRYHFAKGNAHKHNLITFSNAFHGRTIATISATDQAKLRDGFAPLLTGFTVVDFNDLDAALAAMDENTAGFLLEPVQGEGGIRPATHEFLSGLRAACDEHDLMLVFDEVQCGVARTGTLYAYEQYGVVPDIMASAKGIGGGFPMGACLATEKAAAGMVIGTHGSTYGGNPLAMAAGQAVFDIVANEEFLSQVRQKGERLRSALEQMIPNHDVLFDSVRGMGLMLGVKMKTDSRAFVTYLRTQGILTVAAGDNVMRVLPPLTIEEEHIREFVDRLSAAAADYEIPAAA